MSQQIENTLKVLKPRLEELTNEDKITIVNDNGEIYISVKGLNPENIIIKGDGHIDIY